MLINISIILLAAAWSHANDGAAETGVGGLKLRKERSVSMRKEKLTISPVRVSVEYEFINTTDLPVVSEIAFPIPPFTYETTDLGGPRDFSDFKTWVDGKPIKVEKEVRAFVNGREVTEALLRAGINFDRFANFDHRVDRNPVLNLDLKSREELVRIGALRKPLTEDDPEQYWPEWETHIKYHWRQQFPTQTIVRIRHEYKPVAGFGQTYLADVKRDACIDEQTFAELRKLAGIQNTDEPSGKWFGSFWVSYILTTANTWQTPIKDFELVINGNKDDVVTFCWDGPIERVNQTTFRVRKKDFVPGKELKIYFFRNFPSDQ